MTVGISMRALNGDPYCGDLCAYWTMDSKVILCIADGLGHGEGAAAAAAAAVGYVGNHLREPILTIIQGCNKAISGTRGVAMAIAIVDLHEERLTYAGVGNTRGMIHGRRKIMLTGEYGIVGGGFQRLVEENLSLAPGDLLVLWTDGIPEILNLSCMDSDVLADSDLLADRIVADYSLGTDDAAAVVFQRPRQL